jgi:alpha-glucosidase
MKLKMALPLMLLIVWSCFLAKGKESPAQGQAVSSPNNQVKARFSLGQEGEPQLSVSYDDVTLVDGRLGLQFAASEPLRRGFEITGVDRKEHDETYEIAVGKASSARDHHRELIVSLREKSAPGRRLQLAFRAFDDGVAFRYLVPEQDGLADLVLTDELTELTLSNDSKAHFLPLNGYTTSYEQYYKTQPVSAIGRGTLLGLPVLLERATVNKERESASVWFAVTEADLTDYAGMYLAPVEGRPGTLAAKLSPLPGRKDGAKVIGKTPFASPWRVIMVADEPGRLLESNIVFNLSAPSAIAETSWIKPGKTTFPWWNGYAVEGDVDFKPGVNTATMKYYIDFCAEQGIPYHSLDGLDIAWYGGPIAPDGPTDVTKAAPSIDMPELLRYAKEKGVRLRLWVHWKALQPQIDEAFKTYEEWGIEGVMVDFMDRDDQEMVRFYHEMAEKAARHHLTVTLHGSYKPTGMERTWPNVLNYEAALNQEYDKSAGGRGTPPEHNLDVAFVRMLAGPLDYHQGGMRSVLPENYHGRDKAPPVQGTRGHQLAMYVVYQNHLPMMADDPNAYRGQAGLRFMVDVPATWDETRVLHADFGKALVIARRHGDVWYVGGMAAREDETLALPLKFLGEAAFEAEMIFDDPEKGPTALVTERQSISSGDTLEVHMPPSGGFVATLRPAK